MEGGGTAPGFYMVFVPYQAKRTCIGTIVIGGTSIYEERSKTISKLGCQRSSLILCKIPCL